ncbi:hypothetical protein [Pseudosulfitobacter pseudonitzschiae]|uniref:hypothetical protein n=1 Tax=Pseudosulfitobacter pseudonitzschiae TaxID=1402135 RepID=UPI003B813695
MHEDHLEDLARLDTDLGDDCRFKGGTLWRVTRIDASAARKLRAGHPADIPVKRFSCWSKDPLALMNVARHRFTSMAQDQEFLMIRKEVAAADDGIDVEAVFRSLAATEGHCWFRYAALEREVVLRHDEPVLTVMPGMVAGLWRAGEYEAIAPRAGEVFIAEYEDPLVIDEVLHSENGGYVVASGGQKYLLHWEFGELGGTSYENVPDSPDL